MPPDGYYERVQAVLAANEIAFIDDEVICGFGRTGNPFGAQTMGIEPTTMSVAKALSSAYLPISAVLLPEYMYEAFEAMSKELGIFGHGFTYTGHPVCAAVALKNLEIMEERDLFAHAATVGAEMQARMLTFAEHPLVGEVRGRGLIGGIELVKEKAPRVPFPPSAGIGAFCAAACAEEGLVVRNMGDSIAFCPPLIITSAQVDEMFEKFGRGLDATWEAYRDS